MTTKQQLVAIASSDAHKDNKAIQSLLVAINEAYGHQKLNHALLKTAITISDRVIEKDYYYTATDDTIATAATAHAIAVAKLNTLFLTLACALQAMGEKIEY
jgi:hypothetical protein